MRRLFWAASLTLVLVLTGSIYAQALGFALQLGSPARLVETTHGLSDLLESAKLENDSDKTILSYTIGWAYFRSNGIELHQGAITTISGGLRSNSICDVPAQHVPNDSNAVRVVFYVAQVAFSDGSSWTADRADIENPTRSKTEITPAESRKIAPIFSLSDDKGATLRLSDYKGKVVLLNFWATWCRGCVQEMPWLTEIAAKYRDGGLVVVGISMDEDAWKSVRPFLAQRKLNYPIVIGGSELARQYHWLDSLPTSVLIARDGRIAASNWGVVKKEQWETEIETLLREPN